MKWLSLLYWFAEKNPFVIIPKSVPHPFSLSQCLSPKTKGTLISAVNQVVVVPGPRVFSETLRCLWVYQGVTKKCPMQQDQSC